MALANKRTQTNKWYSSDEQFNRLYPFSIQVLARRHWTPLVVARRAAHYLGGGKNERILDIGSGVGKFCLTAAHYDQKNFYYGIEQRKSLINHAETARTSLALENVCFINGNFTQIDFRNYDHFYFFNAFYENLNCTDKIDDTIAYSRDLYNYYTSFLFRELEQKPAGTKLATYHSMEDDGPKGYHIVGSDINHLLKYWVKF
jgi:hypothetical protein